MNNKKLGIALVILSLAVGALLLTILTRLNDSLSILGCLPSDQCREVESYLNVTHLAVGAFSALLSFGIYLLLFDGGEAALLRKLHEEKEEQVKQEKFSILLRALDEHEQKILSIIKEENEVEQNTLRLKSNLSKAKVSQVASELERRGLISREKKNKTYLIRPKI